MAIELTDTTPGYVGIGLGEINMFEVDMVVVETANNTVTVRDFYSFNFSKPILDTSLGGTNDFIRL